MADVPIEIYELHLKLLRNGAERFSFFVGGGNSQLLAASIVHEFIYFRYTWIKVPNHIIDLVKEHGTPYSSPTLVGCAIAVDKKFFNLIGRYVSSCYAPELR